MIDSGLRALADPTAKVLLGSAKVLSYFKGATQPVKAAAKLCEERQWLVGTGEWVGKGASKKQKFRLSPAGVQAVLVALDLETTIGTPPVTNEYVKAMWQRHPDRIIQAWGAVEPAKGDLALAQARKAVRELGLLGFHFHPIMQHFAVNDRRYYPLFEVINELKATVMIDVGTAGMGAGLPGGMGAKIRHAHPSSIDELAADFPNLKIVMAHPGWPWVDEATAVALHKGNVYWEMSGWAPKYFPAGLKLDMRARL